MKHMIELLHNETYDSLASKGLIDGPSNELAITRVIYETYYNLAPRR